MLAFTICVDGEKLDPGNYSGQVSVSGPEGLDATAVTITANAKDRSAFVWGLVLAVIAALALLFYKAVNERKDAAPDSSWGTAWNQTLRSPEFLIQTFIALVGAVLAMLAIYSQDPGWGADPIPSLIALGGTALAAAGLQSVIATARGKSS